MEGLKKIKNRNILWSSNSTSGYTDKGNETTMSRRDICTLMFIAALVKIAMTWKHPKCPLTDEWIKKCNIYSFMYLFISVIKKKKILSFVTTWMDLETIVLTDIKVKVAQSCPTLCNPMDYTVHRILQARILEWVAIPFSRGSSQSRDQTQVSHIAGSFFTSWATRVDKERQILYHL